MYVVGTVRKGYTESLIHTFMHTHIIVVRSQSTYLAAHQNPLEEKEKQNPTLNPCPWLGLEGGRISHTTTHKN